MAADLVMQQVSTPRSPDGRSASASPTPPATASGSKIPDPSLEDKAALADVSDSRPLTRDREDAMPMTSLPSNIATTSTITMRDPSSSSPPPPSPPAEPTIPLTLLLVSGRRRTVLFPAKGTTVLRAKELIWSSWPDEWKDEQPPAPGFLRLLYLGKIWSDSVLLSDLNLQSSPSPPTVIHVSVRPFLSVPEEDISKLQHSKSRRRNRRTSSANATASSGVGQDDAGAGRFCGCIIC